MRVLLTGWPSFLHGEATAGDVLSMQRVRAALDGAGVSCEVAWSPVFRPGALTLEEAAPQRYSHVVFACGPVHGEQLRWLHHRFAGCRRIAVGVTVIDPSDPAVTGFDVVLARDAAGRTARRDLASTVAASPVPVVGVILAPGQREYGRRRRHDLVHDRLVAWLAGLDCARVPLDTRLDPRRWGSCATPDQLDSVVRRLDAVVTTRLHGLVLALRRGVPALAVDPVAGGGKVSAQADAWQWPALLSVEAVVRAGAELGCWWRWCLSPQARELAAERASSARHRPEELVGELLDILDGPAPGPR
jgi:polysaccharide pyruvyl transferase